MHQKLIQALDEVSTFLEMHGVRHLIMGGIANAVWGKPRVTHDIDFKVLLGERSIHEFVALISTHFRCRVADPEAFARHTYVLPIYASNQVAIDLGLGFLPYEEQAVERAISIEYQGVAFPVCTAEDLIVFKAISEREKDWSDIEGILTRQGDKLDQAYVLDWLEQFAQALERPELVQRYRQLLNQVFERKR